MHASRDDLFERLRPLARSLARKYARQPGDIEDLEQVASIGLLKAIDRFDPQRGATLATYARPVIVGELKHWLRDSSWWLKVPRRAQELSVTINAALPQLTARLRRSPTIAEIAEAVGSETEPVLTALEARPALDLRFEEGMTQSEIAEGLGVSAMQVSRILRGAVERAALAA